jgi:hypothetical protein
MPPANTLKAPWLDHIPPAKQMAELRERLMDAADQYVLAELEIRAAARRRNRALSLMRDARHSMIDLATRHNLPVPPTKFGRLLDEICGDDV